MVVSDMQDVDSEEERQYCAFLISPTNNNSNLVLLFIPFFFSFWFILYTSETDYFRIYKTYFVVLLFKTSNLPFFAKFFFTVPCMFRRMGCYS